MNCIFAFCAANDRLVHVHLQRTQFNEEKNERKTEQHYKNYITEVTVICMHNMKRNRNLQGKIRRDKSVQFLCGHLAKN